MLSEDSRFEPEEVRLAGRNSTSFPELADAEVTPIGSHYLVVHFDVPRIDAGSWRLRVGGRVRSSLELSLDEIRARPAVSRQVTLECAGNGRALLEPRPVMQPWFTEAVSTASWRGVSLCSLLEEAGLLNDAVDVVFTGSDRGLTHGDEHNFERSLAVKEACRQEMILAYEMNGQPLPAVHGYPLRLVCPGWYGMASVKWLEQITAIDYEFTGYEQLRAYRYTMTEDDPGEPVTRIHPRSILVPPGLPDSATRRRCLRAGPIMLRGRAWSGFGAIVAVDVSVDGGASWRRTDIDPVNEPYAWQRFHAQWNATPGHFRLGTRAIDEKGNEQPLSQRWTLQGMGNNAVHYLDVEVV